MPVEALPALPVRSDLAWPLGTATPAKTDRFDALIEEAFAEGQPEGPRNTKAIVVIHKGELVAEKYAEGVATDTPLLSWSMAKSVTALHTGLLVKDGLLDPAAPAPIAQWQEEADDPRAAITLDQLLRMSSGLKFNETYSANTDVTQMLSNESSAGDFAASMPLAYEPDTHWAYSSGTTNIIAGINRRALGDTLQAAYTHSQTRLFRPLSIRTAFFETDASGTFIGSSYMYASARDWARLGQFCLQDGAWEGERILPEGWMDYALTPNKASDLNNYGAQFWLNRDPADPERKRTYPLLPEDAYYMGGFQGQIVLVIPSHELVITRFGFTPAENTGIEQLAAGIIAALPEEETLAQEERAAA
jgi:CubicO group peptidase (beta-lactamase class C family)